MNVLKTVLLPFSWLYGIGIVLRNWLYDLGIFRSYAVGVPVISVGNLTVGGSGKTPIVEYIVKELFERNYKVAVVSRGYKRVSKGTVVVSDGHSVLVAPQKGGDEPFQIARKFPSAVVVVDEDRVRGARHAARQYGVEVVVLDDGFQHRALHRDLDILVVDVERSPHRTALLPVGLRREPMSSIKRVDVIMLSRWSEENGSQVKEYIGRKTPAPQFEVQFVPRVLVRLADGTTLELDHARDKSCFAFCGIARPEVLERTVKKLGLRMKGFRAFPDHHYYSHEDIEKMSQEVQKLSPDLVITTEKDAVRLLDTTLKQSLNNLPLYYAQLETQISEPSTFSELLHRTITHH